MGRAARKKDRIAAAGGRGRPAAQRWRQDVPRNYGAAGRANLGRADARFDEALSAFNAGRYDAAIRRLDDVIRMDSQFAPAHHQKGMCLLEKNRPKGAVECCDAALRIDAAMKEPYCTKGIGLILLGRHRTAIKCCNAALRLDPRIR